MPTRAVYEFFNDDERHCVYTHYDGYPDGAVCHLKKALGFAWQLPLFEPDDFAAAFVAANKTTGGDIRLSRGHEDHDDLDFWYEVTAIGKDLTCIVHQSNNNVLFSGTLDQMKKKYEKPQQVKS